MYFRLLLLAGLASLPLLGTAQTTPTAPHYYVGLGASVLTSAPFQRYSTPAIYSPTLTAGGQLSPRWALQLGIGLGWQHAGYTLSDPNGAPSTIYSSTTQDRFLSVPVLARYTFTAPTARWRVDALGGLMLVHTASHTIYTVHYTNGREDEGTDTRYSDNTYSLSLGPAVRYALTPRVELTANALVNAALNRGYYDSFSDRLFLNALVGAHYTFGAN
ncbi:outer membrane beta-barrel protein [Hymenobacter nivis]|uniref:Outer membrane protein beta-barrel domain-containing protein n=1 Tax=Hymenobacter nivis TaxID=1850093 RepID=A0A502GBM7_9BACT|nr:outer membrane beta-barrel protein [Hymenobacter nivis]TPG59489.1 hypothetical protein EAH73_21495 [Hymenobacter nivis]